MTDSLALIGEIDPFTESDKLDAEAVLFDMQNTVESIRRGEIKLAMSWVHLGSLLLKAQTRKHWITWGYDSFGKLIDDLRGKLDRQRSYLYNVVDVSERLLPSVSEDDLDKLGISKANELSRFVKQSSRNPATTVHESDDRDPKRTLLELALDPDTSVLNLHVAVLEALHEKGETSGTWYEPGGFYTTPDERGEIQQANELAKQIEPTIDASLPDHFQRKEVALKLAREFFGTYAGQEEK